MRTSNLITTSKQIITLAILGLLLSSCQESEFYEKKFLKGAGVEKDQDSVPEIDLTEQDPRIADNHTDDGNDIIIPTDGQEQDDDNSSDQGDQNDDQMDDQSGDDDDNTQTHDPDNNGSRDEQDDSSDDQSQDDETNQDQDTSSDDDQETDQDQSQDNSDEDSVDNDQSDSNNDGTDENDNTDSSQDDSNNNDQVNDDQDNAQDPDQDADENDEGNIALAQISESFQQREEQQAKVDILWVIDDSGSMKDEQEALAYNFETFIKDFMKKDVDFRMAITTTDPTRRVDGRMMCNWRNLSSKYAKTNPHNFYRRFKSCVKVGTRGYGREKGLRAVNSFLQKYEHHAQRNGHFLREDAYLSVVFVSDEEDQSYKGTDFYLERMREIKKQKGLVKAYSIVTTEKTGRRWETVGNRYMEVSKQTAGKVANIKDDFHGILNNFGGTIVELASSFALSQQPHGEVEVKVDGEIVEEGWSYSAENRSVKFDEDSLPSAGSTIEVSYKVKKQ